MHAETVESFKEAKHATNLRALSPGGKYTRTPKKIQIQIIEMSMLLLNINIL